ncbi:MAG: hypothetical protein A3F18_05395 [Legionellales bacterium RIFCSPHIGHO2_12_FULL_37_14]|nr:MAG: hypothetical protein A3F18_05395 [Legionellales bacterium RIFCSPHIGHO2_12_FULL_37_14]
MIRLFIILLLLGSSAYANHQQAYLARFNQYQQWMQTLPAKPSADFLQFIQDDKYLAQKLREHWLLTLGKANAWQTLHANYQSSKNIELNCYAALGDYAMGFKDQALNQAEAIWLSANLRPKACKPLFDLLLKATNFSESFIDARLILALNKNNALLVSFLLQQYKGPKRAYIDLFTKILRDPTKITLLPNNNFAGNFYLFGLKRLVDLGKKSRILSLWKYALDKHLLTLSQEQQFIVYYTTYLTLHHANEANAWFAMLKPNFYTTHLLHLQIRQALKKPDWQRVETLIQHVADKNDQFMQYWLARSLEAQGKASAANEIYKSLANDRHYYGFLASMQLNKEPNFAAEDHKVDPDILSTYKPILDKIRALYQQNHIKDASLLLNDFSSELPKDEKIALLYWLTNTLNWYDKVIAMCNNAELKDQLYLRFPTAYKNIINTIADANNLPSALVYALIRQESTFNKNVTSRAGAIGLMQIMPETAALIAKRKHIPYKNKQALTEVKPNVALGSAYLAVLSKKFNHNLILMAAAYNAGPMKVVYWLRENPTKDLDLWVENIPFEETRNYLKNIIAFYVIYQNILRDKVDVKQVFKPIKA